LTSKRPKCGAIGETLNGIAGCLQPSLPILERQYLHKRIAEEYAQLERLEKSQAQQQADLVMAAEALE
jgi:hypothetical protein